MAAFGDRSYDDRRGYGGGYDNRVFRGYGNYGGGSSDYPSSTGFVPRPGYRGRISQVIADRARQLASQYGRNVVEVDGVRYYVNKRGFVTVAR